MRNPTPMSWIVQEDVQDLRLISIYQWTVSTAVPTSCSYLEGNMKTTQPTGMGESCCRLVFSILNRLLFLCIVILGGYLKFSSTQLICAFVGSHSVRSVRKYDVTSSKAKASRAISLMRCGLTPSVGDSLHGFGPLASVSGSHVYRPSVTKGNRGPVPVWFLDVRCYYTVYDVANVRRSRVFSYSRHPNRICSS